MHISKLLASFISVVACGMTLPAFEIDSTWSIECPSNAVPTEHKAASEIRSFIKEISGYELKIVNRQTGSKVIRIQKNEKMPNEAWDVQYTGNGLQVSGGVPNGILYAAYEFIEHGLGCRFLASDTTYIPKKNKIVIPDTFKRAGQPAFTGRNIYFGGSNETMLFRVRSKLNGGIYAGPELGWCDRAADFHNAHTYYLYSSKFPKDKQEWLSLDKTGKRLRGISGSGPGQICLTQPASREFIFKEMVIRINQDRADLKKVNQPFCKYIDLSANDNNLKCVCSGCMAAAEKYGGYSGVMLEFTNDIAARLEKVFPDMLIQTFAYEFTEKAPTKNNIRPRKNVMIHIAQLGGEFFSVTDVQRDTLRSLDHPNNKVALQRFSEWSRYGTPLKMWDYWLLYDQRRNFPYTLIPALAPNLQRYQKNHVCRLFVESEYATGGLLCGRSFVDLTNYLGAKLMVNPNENEQAVIADFMKHYYGPAAKPMSDLLICLEKAMTKEPGNIGKVGIGVSYLTKEFFKNTEKLFAEAERLAKNDPAVLARIGEERIPFDEASLELQNKLGLKIDRKKVLARYRSNYTKAFYRHGDPKFIKKNEKQMKRHLEIMGIQLDIPAQFAGKRVYDFPMITMLNQERAYTEVVDDPAAAGGKAVILSGEKALRPGKRTDAEFHAFDLSFGVYSPTLKKVLRSKKFPRSETFKDEKYHWYFIGKTILVNDAFIYGHWSWKMTFKCLTSVYNPVLPEAEYGIWMSIKVEGPAYVPGSKKANAIYVDRIIVTKE